ncbi:MAG: hypothetical protein ACOZF0_20960 [Thermodesulfobacteriota bacterium]
MENSAKNELRDEMEASHPLLDNHYRRARCVIKNLDSFQHPWKPGEKEILYILDGIIHNLPVAAIERDVRKDRRWIRGVAGSLLALHQHTTGQSADPAELAERLSLPIDHREFIHWLFTYWSGILPERKVLFEWLVANQPRYRDAQIIRITRLEYLYWGKQNKTATKQKKPETDLPPAEISADTLTRLAQINDFFKELRRALLENGIESNLAKDLLERINLMTISQNLIQEYLNRFV